MDFIDFVIGITNYFTFVGIERISEFFCWRV